jgi:3-phenylpropionate/trans-cinnamate dioxygenase ferredoxin component
VTEGSRFVPVAGENDVAPGEMTVVGAEGRSFALARTADGRWGAIDNVCTHDGGTLGEGELEGQCVECPRHGAQFDLFTGQVKALPAVYPVNSYPIRVRDGVVEIDLGVPTKELEIG